LKTHQSRGARGLIRTTLVTALLLCSWAMSGLATAATANSAQALASEPGTYRIFNVASHSSLRAYNAGQVAYVSSTREYPGPFELWKIERSGSTYTIKNVGLDSYAAAPQTEEGASVVTNRAPSTWSIESAGDNTYVIKVPNEDLLWNAEPPVIPRGDVRLRGADGSETQRWRLAPADQ
jgi:hypothetical protein